MKTLYIHPGYHKSASTFIQQNIFFSAVDFFNLSKNAKNNSYNIDIYEFQKKVFISKHLLSEHFSTNDPNFVKYVNYLKKKITQFKKNKFIISDVNILDNFNYNQKYNIQILSKIISELKKSINLRIKIILIIRNQVSLVKSYYSYEYAKLKYRHNSFTKFINFFEKNHDLNTQYNFFTAYNNLSKITSDILVIPFEKLQKDRKSFLEELTGFLNFSQSNIDNLIEKEKELSNLNRGNINKDIYPLREIKKFSIYQLLAFIYHFLPFKFEQFKNFIKYFVKVKYESNKVIDYKNEQIAINKIKDLYLEENKKIDSLKKLKLNQYGYFN